jgi:2-haloalkanoic acid dehalogenase type II
MWFDQSWSNDGMRVERVVFDLYGTLLDVGGLAGRLRPFLGDAAPELLGRWRKAQIERTWELNRRGEYEPFDEVTSRALAEVAPQLAAEVRAQMCATWLSLPAFADAAAALETLARAGVQRWILSNGTFAMIRAALDAAGLVLDEVRSADQVRAYKTDPRVYSLVPREGTLFVSGNGWDAEGAKRFGLAVAWLDRGGPAPGAAPDLRFGSLAELAAQVAWRDRGVRVVKGTELDTNTPQTPGMSRAAAITHARVGAEKLWMGTVVIHPNAKTGAHHHGELESVIYVVTGRARMRWGEKLEFTAEAGPGDFIYVPPFVPHQEINANRDQELSCVVVRSGQEPVVVNLDIAPAEPPEEVKWIDPIHH